MNDKEKVDYAIEQNAKLIRETRKIIEKTAGMGYNSEEVLKYVELFFQEVEKTTEDFIRCSG